MLRSCPGCKRFFEDYTGLHERCPSCRETEDELLRDVKDYLWVNPGTTEAKLEEVFNVSRQQVEKWLREGRLEVTPNSAIQLKCDRCGSMISTGRYCKDCELRIRDGFKKVIEDQEMEKVIIENVEPKRDHKMHFLHK